MEKKSVVSRHFFKVMMPGFQEKLILPPAFCEKLEIKEISRVGSAHVVAFVTTSKGKWKIKVRKNHKGLNYSFEEGWPDFVRQHALVLGDFVVFEHIGNMRFNAFVFDSTTTCEKHDDHYLENEAPQGVINRNNRLNETKSKVARGTGGDQLIYRSPSPHFIATMKPYHALSKGILNIPAEFLKSNDHLYGKMGATLRDPCGKTWPVRLIVHKRYQNSFRGTFGGQGWHALYKSNKLKDGDVCLFELVNSSSKATIVPMDVQIFRAP